MSTEPSIEIHVTRRYSASPERVFDAWLDPVLIGQWMFGQRLREEEVLHLNVDARVGGTFSFLVRRQGNEIDHVGTYHEIDRPRRLVFTWGIAGDSAEESRVIIDIVPLETGCELTLTHEMHPKWAEYRDRTQAGWTKMTDMLATVMDESQQT